MEFIVWMLGPLWALVLSASVLAVVRKNIEIERTFKRKPWLDATRVVNESPEDRLKCGCGHHFAYHDRRTGRCDEQVGRSEYSQRQGRAETRYSRCRCRGYTGVVPPRAGESTSDDVTTRLLDGTELTFPRHWGQGTGTEVVQWVPLSSRRSES